MNRAHAVERIAHRGARRELPENSLPAFQRAFERGADAIELDVHATRDGVVIVHHDPSFGREVSPAPLRGRRLAELTSDEVAGARLAAGAAVPTLAAVLAAVPSGRRVYVEMKGLGIEQAVADVVRRAGVECAVHSFDHFGIERLREIAPEIPRGVLYERGPRDLVSEMRRAGARDVWPRWKLIDAALVAAVHEEGGRVIGWTVNTATAIRDLTALGVDGICSDDVRLVS
jgi:glycerophosphoryl diester phosphodiesterase